MAKQEHALSLQKVKDQLTASQIDLMNWQTSLRAAMINTITPADLQAIMEKQIKKAKEGDERALKFVMSQVLGNGPALHLTQNNIVTDPATAAIIAKAEQQ